MNGENNPFLSGFGSPEVKTKDISDLGGRSGSVSPKKMYTHTSWSSSKPAPPVFIPSASDLRETEVESKNPTALKAIQWKRTKKFKGLPNFFKILHRFSDISTP